jgi:excisionase family DNA binding protein
MQGWDREHNSQRVHQCPIIHAQLLGLNWSFWPLVGECGEKSRRLTPLYFDQLKLSTPIRQRIEHGDDLGNCVADTPSSKRPFRCMTDGRCCPALSASLGAEEALGEGGDERRQGGEEIRRYDRWLAPVSIASNKLLLNPQEAAKALSINRSTLYALLVRGEIPSIQIGRARRIPVQVLEVWIAGKLAA